MGVPAHWIEAQYRRAAAAMQTSISPTAIRKSRPGFGQHIVPVRGAIVASPVPAAYDPDPDYFFHWYRDAAIVIDALRQLHECGAAGPEAMEHFTDFVHFSRSLESLDGAPLAAAAGRRNGVAAGFVRYLRVPEELAAVRGPLVAAESRVNPDGTLDISRWSRPQFDGPPLRALAVLRWLGGTALHPSARAAAAALLRSDIAFILRYWNAPGFDIWEEELGEHYYNLCISAAALRAAARWRGEQDEIVGARQCQAMAAQIAARLDDFWLADSGHYRSRVLTHGPRSTKELDISVILAAVHAGESGAAHTVDDPRLHATLDRLDAVFNTHYRINRERAPGEGPAMGRYAGDAYYSGGAYYFSTLGAAEFCYRAAINAERSSWMARGDAYLATVRRYTPDSGDMSEQFDQETGRQTSAKHLAWSYAGFISCIGARRALVGCA